MISNKYNKNKRKLWKILVPMYGSIFFNENEAVSPTSWCVEWSESLVTIICTNNNTTIVTIPIARNDMAAGWKISQTSTTVFHVITAGSSVISSPSNTNGRSAKYSVIP